MAYQHIPERGWTRAVAVNKHTSALPLLTMKTKFGKLIVLMLLGFPRLTSAEPLTVVQLPAPRLRLASGAEVVLERVGSTAEANYRAPAGSPAEGVTVTVTLQRFADEENYNVELQSSVTLSDVQLVQPILVGVDWRSYVIAPGAIYNGNRYLASPQAYAPYLLTEGVSPDGPIVIGDIPRLTSDRGYRADLAANALSIPAVAFHDENKNLGVLVGIDVYGKWGVTGVSIITLPGQLPSVEVCLPVRRKLRFQQTAEWVPTNERGIDLKPGMAFTTRIHVQAKTEARITDLVTRIAKFGFSLRGTEPRRPNLGLAKSAKLIEAKLNAYNWDETNGYYTSTMDNAWKLQTGWVGGGVTFYAMAMSDDSLSRQRAIRMMDVICRDALTRSGYFHGLHKDGRWQSFGAKRPGCRAFSLIRRPLECTRDVLKVMNLLRQRGESVDPAWERAARLNLDAIVRTADRFGHLGYTVDFDTGDVLWGDSACGAFGLETLVLGAAWFKEPRYLATAGKLAEYYVKHFVHHGITMGGVGDALMAADSESNYALLAGLMALYDATKEPRYLVNARETADLLCTWVLYYDARLPANSPLGKLGLQPRGAVFANTQNQHGTPGMCTTSGIALLQLYEATGEERYLRTLEDIAQCAPQMVVQKGQGWIWGKLPIGCVSERLMTMDGLRPTGYTDQISTWAEIALLHMARELPTTYRDELRGRDARFSTGQ
jgi:N-acylglucosamine 2-epimerase (GlcNAc 2-epimerase)